MASYLEPGKEGLIARFNRGKEIQLYTEYERGPFKVSCPTDAEQAQLWHTREKSQSEENQIVATDPKKDSPFPKLSDLNVSNLRVERKLLISFLQAPHLTKLRLRNCGLDDDAILLLCDCLKTSQKIEELCIDDNRLSSSTTQKVLENLPLNIRVVNIEGNYLDDSGTRYLANLLTRSQIRQIQVSPNLSEQRTWPQAIAEAVPNSPFLRRLDLSAMSPAYAGRDRHPLTLAEARPMLELLDNPSCLSLDIVSFSNSYIRNYTDQILQQEAAALVTEREKDEQRFRANSRILISKPEHLDGDNPPRYFIPAHKKDARHCADLPFADVMRYLVAENQKFPIRRLFLENLTGWIEEKPKDSSSVEQEKK